MRTAFDAAKGRLLTIKDKIANFRADEAGAALVEYALLAGLAAVIIVAAMTSLSGHVTTAFDNIGAKLDANNKIG